MHARSGATLSSSTALPTVPLIDASALQLGTPGLRNLDPFLMLDELKCPSTEAAAGFPNHPHRGFETCSIMISGKMEHKDSHGNQVRCKMPCLHMVAWQTSVSNGPASASWLNEEGVSLQGVIMDGGVQWMTAGRGIVHSEMPKITQGDLWGFQLWINLPAKDKMIKPRYQDYQASDIPTVSAPSGCDVRVMAGEFQGSTGAAKAAR